jgi:hypothetical protein
MNIDVVLDVDKPKISQPVCFVEMWEKSEILK